MPRRASLLLILALSLSVLGPADARPTVVERRSFYEYLLSADDVLVVHVDSTGGPRYGKWAQVSVHRSFKGTVTSDTIRLPFEYQSWPRLRSAHHSVSVSTARDRTFEAGQRLLVLVARRPIPDTTTGRRRTNPYAAPTRYVTGPLPSGLSPDLDESTIPLVWVVEHMLRAHRAETASAQAAALRPLLRHESPQVRRVALEAARQVAPDPLAPMLLRQFKENEAPELREAVTAALAPLDHPDVTPALLDAAPEYAPALTALGRRTDASLADPLTQMYESIGEAADEGTIRDLFRALREHAGPRHVPTFIRWYEQAERAERWDPILHLIGATHTESGTAFVGQVLETGETPARRIEAAEVAKQRSLDALAPLLLRRFGAEPDAKVRRAITQALSELTHPRITPTLLDAAPTYPPALQALSQRTDTTLARPLLRVYEAVADTAGPGTRRALRRALDAHLSPEHAPAVARLYERAPTPDDRRWLLSLIGPMKTSTSDSLLASVVTGADARDLRLRAAQLMRRHGTRRPDALAHALEHDESPRIRQVALQALGAAGSLSHLDDVVAYAPPPCAGTRGPGVFATAWQTITEWIWGDAERTERPWTPNVFSALQDLGRAHAEHPQPVMDALGPYLACQQFEGVSIVAAKTLFALDPVAARPVLRNRLAQDPTPRVRETLRHLVWLSSQIDSS